MLKYCWIIMLAVVWIMWLIATIIDVIDTFREDGLCFDLLFDLDDSSQVFITLTLLILFITSFIAWLMSRWG